METLTKYLHTIGLLYADDLHTDMKINFGLKDYLTTPFTNQNMAFVGSSNLSAFVEKDRISFILSDAKTMRSLIGHATHKFDHYRTKGNNGYGNTYQFYNWSAEKKSTLWFLGEFQRRNHNTGFINGEFKPLLQPKTFLNPKFN